MAAVPASATSGTIPAGAIPRIPANPTTVSPTSKALFEVLPGNSGTGWTIVRLTKHGNNALRECCSTPLQRQVWSWPVYEFMVKLRKDRTLVISADQVRFVRPSFPHDLSLTLSPLAPVASTVVRERSLDRKSWLPLSWHLREVQGPASIRWGCRTTAWGLGWGLCEL